MEKLKNSLELPNHTRNSCVEAVLVDSLMTVDTQSIDQSVAQQLTTFIHELFTPFKS